MSHATSTPQAAIHPITRRLVEHYDRCLAQHGPNAQGMDWGPHEDRLQLRFAAICRAAGISRSSSRMAVLDVGCGCGLFLDYLIANCIDRVDYAGLDASMQMIEAARSRHPSAHWIVGDIASRSDLPSCDWVVANGLLTERRETPQDEMESFAQCVLRRMFALCRVGIVFNVLTTHVNFRNPDLFYWEPGQIISFATNHLARHVVLYHDLSLYDIVCCIRKTPWDPTAHDNA